MSGLIRHFAAGPPEDPIPGDAISMNEQHAMLTGMREHMRDLGWPVEDHDSRGYEQLGPNFHLESGHHVSIGVSRKDLGWVMHVHHPDDGRPQKTILRVNLGTRPGDVPRLAQRELGCRHVTGEMMRQMQVPGGREMSARMRGTRQRRDIASPEHDAEGAALPPGDDAEGW